MRVRNILALGAMLTLAAMPAAAQFTTVVAPPKKEVPAVQAQAAQAAADTSRRTALRDMSAWVDSVAGAPAPVVAETVIDSAAGAVEPTPEPQAASTEKFSEGARAPDTATALPFLLLLGLTSLGAGIALLATRRRPEPVRRRAP